ncbi:DUF4097 family beta strand repeat-containing protein [Kitasatospora sp. NPDC052896]|uniref:DUF4097 family beta strand repeat-containing protein n=1 Tax=Kitasatospora sp. NPDC052896 TaxID=3364061 RepID=UPI0037C8D9DA
MSTKARSSTAARGGRWAVAVAVAAVAVTGLVSGCSVLDSRTDSQSYQVTDAVKSVNVDDRGGSIEVVATDQSTVTVVETYTYSDGKPRTTHSVRDGELTLQANGCSSSGFGHVGSKCDVSYRLEVPRATATHLTSDGGSISLEGLSGTTYAHTSGGAVDVHDSAATDVTAQTDGGSVDVRLDRTPDQVDAESGGGSVRIRVPKGSYAVDLDGSVTGRSVGVTTDPTSTHRIKAHTGGGSVSVEDD